MEAVREGELHPLQNSSVLQVIFQNLKLGDLKSCRLVCREWCRESTAAMKEVPSVVRIIDDDGKRISDFLELVRVEGEENVFAVPPFMKDFDIQWWFMDWDSETFWEVCGNCMKSLALGGITFESSDVFRHVIFQSCPNLEALSMSCVRMPEANAEEPNEWMPPKFPPNRNLKSLKIGWPTFGEVSWMEILSQFPAIEKFHPRYGVSSLAGFFRSLTLARRNDDQCWKIKDLLITMDGIHTPLTIFGPATEDLKLPLEKLQVITDRPIAELIPFQRFLTVHAPILTDLILECVAFTGNQMMQLLHLPNNAVFENVKKLRLFHARLRLVNFLRWFPNLKNLNLIYIDPEPEFSQEIVGNWILESCTELEMSMNHFKTEDLRQLLSKLPNLKSLIASFPNNDKFQVICELLLELEHLELTDGQVNDIGISGLDDEDVARINQEGPEGDWWPMTVARPNLIGLMNLKRFRIRMYGTDMGLGYSTAVCVQQLPHLQKICLEGYTHLHPILEDLQLQFPWTPR